MQINSLLKNVTNKNSVSDIRFLHTADIQVNANGIWKHREFEYRYQLREIANAAISQDCEVVVVPGDIFERAITSENEKQIIVDWVYDLLSLGIEVVFTPGNHDLRQKNFIYDDGSGSNKTQVDSIELLHKSINNPHFHYIQRSGFYKIEVNSKEFIFANWSHKTLYSDFPEEYNPWDNEENAKKAKDSGLFIIDLYHNPVYNCEDWDGSVVKGNNDNRVHPNEFRGDLALLGDIHIPYIGKTDSGSLWSYCSSPVLRNFGEGDYYFNEEIQSERLNRHGYNIVDITFEDKSAKINFVPLPQYNGLHTIDLKRIDESTVENFELKNPGQINSVRIRTNFSDPDKQELVSKLVSKLKENYAIKEIDLSSPSSSIIKNEELSDDVSLEQLFDKEYLIKLCNTLAEEFIKDTTEDEAIRKSALEEFNKNVKEQFDHVNLNTDKNSVKLKKIILENFMSFESLELDLENLSEESITQILGSNGVGKTTIFKAIIVAATKKYCDAQILNRKDWLLNMFNDKLPESDSTKVELHYSLNSDDIVINYQLDKVWKSSATKTSENWRKEVSKVEQTYLMKVNGSEIIDSEMIEDIRNKSFGSYEELTEMHNIDQSKLSNLINLKHDKLVNWILNQIGAGFVLELQKSRFDVKQKTFEDLRKPLKPLHELEFEKSELNDMIKSSDEAIEKNNSIVKLLEDKILDKSKSIAELKSFEKTVISDELKTKTVEELEIEKTYKIAEISLKNQEIKDHNTKLSKLKDDNKVFDDKILEIKENIASCNKEIFESSSKSQELIKSISDKESKISNYSLEYINTENEKIKNLNVANNKSKQVIDEIKASKQEISLEILKSKNEKINLAIEKLTKLLTSKNDEITNKNLEINSKESLIKSNSDSLSKLKETLDNPICPTCKQSMSSADSLKQEISKIELDIKNLKSSLELVNKDLPKLIEDKSVIEKNIKDLRLAIENSSNTLSKYIEENSSESITKFNNLNTELLNEQSKIDSNIKIIEAIQNEIAKVKLGDFPKELLDSIDSIKKEIEELNSNKDKVNKSILEIGEKVNQYRIDIETQTSNKSDESKILLDIQTIQNLIDKNTFRLKEIELDKVNLVKYLNDLEIEKSNQIKISEFNSEIISTNADLVIAKSDRDKIQNILTSSSTKIDTLNIEIDNAKRYHIANLSFKVYNKIIGDTVLQNILFSKLSSILNSDLDDLLKSVNFKIGFDKDTHNFIFIDKVGGNTIRPISSISGMEETFSALALIAVIKKRKIKQNVNFLMIDEITGKLNDGNEISDLDNSAKNYQELIGVMIQKVSALTNSKIVIIDHVINNKIFNNRIVILKDENGISRLKSVDESELVN